jgi:hypothetical protein
MDDGRNVSAETLREVNANMAVQRFLGQTSLSPHLEPCNLRKTSSCFLWE